MKGKAQEELALPPQSPRFSPLDFNDRVSALPSPFLQKTQVRIGDGEQKKPNR